MKKHSWILILYIIIGIGAFVISYFLEATVFVNITNAILFGFTITAVFECAKVMTIVVNRFLKTHYHKIPTSVEILNWFFKAGLISLSFICSIAIISNHLDRPNMKSVRSKDTKLYEKIYSEKIASLKSEHDKRIKTISEEIKEKYAKRLAELKRYYEPRIEREEKNRDYEFRRIVNGVRKGPHWHEHDRKIGELTKQYRFGIFETNNNENEELNDFLKSEESEYRIKLEKIEAERENSIKSFAIADYKDDERVKNQMIASFLFTVNKGFDINSTYFGFTLFFALLISALLETTIFITFNYAVLYHEKILNNDEIADENQEQDFYDDEAEGYPFDTDEVTENDYVFEGDNDIFGQDSQANLESGFNQINDTFSHDREDRPEC